MIRSCTLLCLGTFLAATAASAQEATPSGLTAADDKADTFNEVERGFFVGASAGPFFIVNPPAPAGARRPFSPGQMAQVELGVDIGTFLSLSAFLSGTANRAGSDYTGLSGAGGSASGDFAALVPGAAARLNLVGFEDAYQTKRTWLYLRAGAGLALFSPRQLLPTPDILVFGGPGVEYYTRLRHFSVGVELSGSYLLATGTFGFAVTPNLRYAF
ncbi:MAG TPA: adventurous gliding motility protein CglE [Myxococcaceae bacterium]|nr:adventurous gliding motility protein CglE [Myxococcaceae bacterium]